MVGRIAAYVAGTCFGAMVSFGVVFAVGQAIGGLPQVVLGAVAMMAFLAGVHTPLRELPQSAWRVPRPGRYPDALFPLTFGFALGTGVMTALPAVSFYLVVVSPLAAGSVAQAALVGLAFAAARATPLAVVAVLTHVSRDNVAAVMGRRAQLIDGAMRVEPAVLLLVAAAAFTGASL